MSTRCPERSHSLTKRLKIPAKHFLNISIPPLPEKPTLPLVRASPPPRAPLEALDFIRNRLTRPSHDSSLSVSTARLVLHMTEPGIFWVLDSYSSQHYHSHPVSSFGSGMGTGRGSPTQQKHKVKSSFQLLPFFNQWVQYNNRPLLRKSLLSSQIRAHTTIDAIIARGGRLNWSARSQLFWPPETLWSGCPVSGSPLTERHLLFSEALSSLLSNETNPNNFGLGKVELWSEVWDPPDRPKWDTSNIGKDFSELLRSRSDYDVGERTLYGLSGSSALFWYQKRLVF